MQVIREFLGLMREDAVTGGWCGKVQAASCSLKSLGDRSPPKIVSVQEMRGNDCLLTWFLSPDEEP